MLVALLAIAAAPEHHPAFFWSPQTYDGLSRANSREHLAEATGADLEATLGAIVGAAGATEGGSHPLIEGTRLSASNAPEVALVFLADGLQTDAVRQYGAHLPVVKSLLDKSESALTIPFTLPVERPLFSKETRVAGVEAEDYFKRNAALFTNGVPDVVVVQLEALVGSTQEAFAAHDELISRITRAVDAGTRGKYAALLTAGHGERGALRRLQSVPGPAYLHTTPTLLTAQLVMLILMVIFLAGFCCLFSLQTPKKFDEVKQAS